MNWYQLDTKPVFRELDTSANGLTCGETEARPSEYRPNRLAAAEKISTFKIIVHQFTRPLIYILLIAAR